MVDRDTRKKIVSLFDNPSFNCVSGANIRSGRKNLQRVGGKFFLFFCRLLQLYA